MTARDLVVDLAVHYEELAGRPRPIWRAGVTVDDFQRMSDHEKRLAWGTTRERFGRWYAFGERLFHLAIAAGIAALEDRPADAIASLREVVGEGYLLDELHGALADGLDYIGHEYGYFYGGQPWDELCVFRSGVDFIHELCERPIDDEVERKMATYGIEMFEPLEIPPGMPRRHWWWFGSSP